VETFIHRHALEYALASPDYVRLLLGFDGGRLICCMAHHLERLIKEDGGQVFAARLQLLALGIDDQGRRLHDGTRLSDMFTATLIADALAVREVKVLSAIVAFDNVRSVALCKRHGLRSEARYDARHVRLSGHFMSR
jgi:hypothetical protein